MRQSGNQVGDEGANAISEALKQNQSVQQLDLVRFIFEVLCVLNARCCNARVITRAVQGRNQVSVAATCYLISCIVHNAQFTDVNLDHAPSACVGTAAWGNAGLPVPPSEVVALRWKFTLSFIRVRRVCAPFWKP